MALSPTDIKICKGCGETKTLHLFGRTGKYYKSKCKECLNIISNERYRQHKVEILAREKIRHNENKEEINKRQREHYHNNKDKTRAYNLKRYYGITIDQYDAILLKQGGGCAICGKTPDQEKRNLAVDHDHKNLAIRGLLCGWCNRHFVGHHRDPALFTKAGEYLSRHTGLFVPDTAKKRKRSRKKRKSKET